MPILQPPHFFFSWQMPIVVCPVDLLCPIAVTRGRTCSLVSTVGCWEGGRNNQEDITQRACPSVSPHPQSWKSFTEGSSPAFAFHSSEHPAVTELNC